MNKDRVSKELEVKKDFIDSSEKEEKNRLKRGKKKHEEKVRHKGDTVCLPRMNVQLCCPGNGCRLDYELISCPPL